MVGNPVKVTTSNLAIPLARGGRRSSCTRSALSSVTRTRCTIHPERTRSRHAVHPERTRLSALSTRREVKRLFQVTPSAAAFSPDGQMHSAAFSPDGQVHAVAFSPDGKRVVSGSEDMLAMIWNAETGTQVSELFRVCRGTWPIRNSPPP